MINYKKMYFELFNALSDAIVQLQQAQQKAEEAYMEDIYEGIYIEETPPALMLIESGKGASRAKKKPRRSQSPPNLLRVCRFKA